MKRDDHRSLTVGTAAGVLIGVVWIAMALAALWSSAQGFDNGRSDWALAWGLVGMLLLVAGSAALAGSLMHRSHVLNHDQH